MKIKAVSFDIGHTLVKYNNPLNWKALYKPAFKHISDALDLGFTQNDIRVASKVMSKYNTRQHPRENEINATIIFADIFNALDMPNVRLDGVLDAFYGFFQNGACLYDDAIDTLKALKSMDLKLGVLTDVAYGMGNKYSLSDIKDINDYFSIILTSVDVGYRKPNAAGFNMLLQAFHLHPYEMIYVGDEQKDIDGANELGIVSALINREGKAPKWGQKYTIRSLLELVDICE